MISLEILARLVPKDAPRADFPVPRAIRARAYEVPSGQVGIWAAYLRFRIFEEARETPALRRYLESSGFVGTGVIRVSQKDDATPTEGFPVVNGYRFGALLLRAALSEEAADYRTISLDAERFQAPMIQELATFDQHAPVRPDGYVAAVFTRTDGINGGITARHVVEGYRQGARVPVRCSVCRQGAQLAKKAPGLMDAATVEFKCGGPEVHTGGQRPDVRSAIEGEAVDVHFGDSGKKSCTVMQALSTAAQLLSAAAPQHFLIDLAGQPGDSGSLVSEPTGEAGNPALIGMYLGQTRCEDVHGNSFNYGYGLDLPQAAAILGATGLLGDFNV
jgi:hypothetical protein